MKLKLRALLMRDASPGHLIKITAAIRDVQLKAASALEEVGLELTCAIFILACVGGVRGERPSTIRWRLNGI